MNLEWIQALRTAYQKRRTAEENRRAIRGDLPFDCTILYTHDGHFVEYRSGHRVPVDEFYDQHGIPATDPKVLADLDAKLKILATYERWQKRMDGGEEMSGFEKGALAEMYAVCRMLADAERVQP